MNQYLNSQSHCYLIPAVNFQIKNLNKYTAKKVLRFLNTFARYLLEPKFSLPYKNVVCGVG